MFGGDGLCTSSPQSFVRVLPQFGCDMVDTEYCPGLPGPWVLTVAWSFAAPSPALGPGTPDALVVTRYQFTLLFI